MKPLGRFPLFSLWPRRKASKAASDGANSVKGPLPFCKDRSSPDSASSSDMRVRPCAASADRMSSLSSPFLFSSSSARGLDSCGRSSSSLALLL